MKKRKGFNAVIIFSACQQTQNDTKTDAQKVEVDEQSNRRVS